MHPSIRPALQPKHNAHGPAALVRLVAHPAVVRKGCGLADSQLGVAHKEMDVDAQSSVNSVADSGVEVCHQPHHSFQAVPHTATATVLLQMVALGQVAEMQLEGVATGTRQLDGIHHRDAPVLSGEFHDLQ